MPKIHPCGQTSTGQRIERVSLETEALCVDVLSFGAVIERVLWKRPSGFAGPSLIPVTLGYGRPEDYENDPYYCGSFVGRTTGRIGCAEYFVDGAIHRLSANWKHRHHLHGGRRGFSHQPWEISHISHGREPEVCLKLCSLPGDEGHPGQCDVTLTYRLQGGSLDITCHATSLAATHVNLTSHIYLNLSGQPQETVNHHLLKIRSQALMVCDSDLIPTGELLALEGTAFDFRETRSLGNLPIDHSFLVSPDQEPFSGAFLWAATLQHPSGVGCNLTTNQPVVHIYTGDYLGGPFRQRGGVCLEAQYPPDACHHPQLPSTLLRPSQDYWHRTRYTFFEI